MKKNCLLLAVVYAMVIGLVCSPVGQAYAAGGGNIVVIVNGTVLQTDADPFIENGRTLVPLRAIAEALSVDILWDQETKGIFYYNKAGQGYSLKVGESRVALEQGAGITPLYVDLDVAPKIVNSRTFVPLRFVAESLNAAVDYDGKNKIVYVGEIEQNTNSSTQNGMMYDVDITSGEYAGYKKLLNHPYEGLYEIHFTVSVNGSIVSQHIITKSLIEENDDMLITFTGSDGQSITLPRKSWYSLFFDISQLKYGPEVLQEKYGDFYMDWVLKYWHTEPEKIAEQYIKDNYIPKAERTFPVLTPEMTLML